MILEKPVGVAPVILRLCKASWQQVVSNPLAVVATGTFVTFRPEAELIYLEFESKATTLYWSKAVRMVPELS